MTKLLTISRQRQLAEMWLKLDGLQQEIGSLRSSTTWNEAPKEINTAWIELVALREKVFVTMREETN